MPAGLKAQAGAQIATIAMVAGRSPRLQPRPPEGYIALKIRKMMNAKTGEATEAASTAKRPLEPKLPVLKRECRLHGPLMRLYHICVIE